VENKDRGAVSPKNQETLDKAGDPKNAEEINREAAGRPPEPGDRPGFDLGGSTGDTSGGPRQPSRQKPQIAPGPLLNVCGERLSSQRRDLGRSSSGIETLVFRDCSSYPSGIALTNERPAATLR